MMQSPTRQTTGTSGSQGQNSWDFYDPLDLQRQTPLPHPVTQVTPQGGIAKVTPRKKNNPWLVWAALLALTVLLGTLGSTNIFTGDEGGGLAGRPPSTATGVANPAPFQSATPGPTPAGTPGGQIGSLPQAWTASGRGQAEFIEAKNVAETFVSHYEMLDWRSRNTFDQATFAMTQAALAVRFLNHDNRANPTFVNDFIQKQRILTPSLASSETGMLGAVTAPNGFFVWLSVRYSLLHQQRNEAPFWDQHRIVVLLVSTPFGTNSVVGGVGWLVSGWDEGSEIFAIPDQP